MRQTTADSPTPANITTNTTATSSTPPMTPSLPPVPHSTILCLTSALIGIQFCWAVQVGYVTKSLLELGLNPRFVSYAWLAGPIAGIVMQPIVGLFSDRCTHPLGRRRPFLIFGSLLAAACILIFAYAAQIGRFLGDQHPNPHTSFEPRPRALIVAIGAFWALDFSINAAQGPLRALLSDVVPPEQHKLGNAYFALATGLGNCFGSLMGAVPLSRWLTVFPGDLQALFTIAALVLLFFVAVTVVGVKERPVGYDRLAEHDHVESGYGGVERTDNQHVGFVKAGLEAPYPFWETFLVQCFTWFGWFCMFVFATSWVGKEVFHGRFDAPEGSDERILYDRGVRMGNLGIGLQSVLTIFCSLALPSLLKRWSSGVVFFVSHLLLGTALSSALFLTKEWQAWIAVGMLASTGFSWAVTMTVPWSLMSEAVSKRVPERAGIYFTMFNLSQCLPEVLVSLVSEEVERVTESQAAVLGLGGMAVYIGGALIVLMGLGMRNRIFGGKGTEGEALADQASTGNEGTTEVPAS